MVSLLIGVAFTAVVYGFGPLLLLAFHHGPIKPKALKWFHCIYTVILSLLFNFASSMMGYGCNFTPAIIWGLIFYNINKSQFKKREPAIPQDIYAQQVSQLKTFVVDDATGEVISETPISKPEPIQEPEPIVLTYHSDFIPSGPPQSAPEKPQEDLPLPQQQGSKKTKIIGLVLALVCIASLAGNAVQAYLKINTQTQLAKIEEDLADKDTLIQNLKESSSTLQKQLTDAQDDINVRDNMIDEIAPEAFAMKTYIGFIYDGSKYCHSYNCSQFPFEDCASDGFYAHNVEYCEWLGYPKHSGCWD